jgi:hypothetical protein
MALILGAVVWIQLAARPARAGSAEPIRALRRRYPADA